MNIRTRLLAVASAAIVTAGLGVAVAAPAGAVTSFAVGNDHVTCNTLSGTITFATALKLSGPTTGAQTITVKAAVAGCTDSDQSGVKMFSGTLASTLTSNGGHSCGALLGNSNSTNNSRITWKPAAGQAFTPTVLVGTVQKPVTDITSTQVNGSTFAVPPANTPWSTTYGLFSIGAAYGTAPISATQDFTGGDGGATGWFTGTTQQDLGNIINSCTSALGLKTISFGIGALHGG